MTDATNRHLKIYALSHQPVTSILSKARGVNTFQPKCMSWSYLSLGSVPRIQMKKKARLIVFIINHIGDGSNGPCHPPKKKVAASPPRTMMFIYSPTKKRPNRIPEYSAWKPATSSPSASGRSNGIRLHRSEEHTSE